MAKHLPEWVFNRYAKLWSKFKDKEFSYEDAKDFLKEKTAMSVLLSELKEADWIEVKLNPQDTRKRIYKLKNPEKAIKEEIKEVAKGK